ncbi:CYC2-like cyclin 4 [Trypanosoma conorhini]|uniref:CYC2-like cyclin 4 n=1 Tax=Trypanosoma conorhini TaxID=83891 RepID=A0A3R7NE41_9TRYP|nr:CYC2-like cyclin 4 [Trypanosoma conorhini]RNF17256.1 CYC2-like cyclin 4 [Trypanosoma conorhini]
MANSTFTGHPSVDQACYTLSEAGNCSGGNPNGSHNTNHTNNNSNSNKCSDNTNTTTNGVSRGPAPAAAAAAAHFSAAWPRNGSVGGQGYSNIVPSSTNGAARGPATTAAVEGDTAGAGSAGCMGVEDDDSEADDGAEKRACSSNEVPTPETCTDTTPTTTADEGFGQTHEEGPRQEQRQRGCEFARDAATPPSHHREGASGAEVSGNSAQGVAAAGGAAEAEEDVGDASYLAVALPVVHRPLPSRVDVATARVAVTLFLEHLCEENKAEPVLTSEFHSHLLPPISVESYLDRIVHHGSVAGETLIVSLMLLLKCSHFIKHPVSIYNVHRLMITSALLGAKLREDFYLSNEYYSHIGGISNAEMNKLELRFCDWLEWDIWVEEAEYAALEALLLRLVTDVTANAAGADEATRRSAQHDFWVAQLRPWKERFEAASVRRLDRIRRYEGEDMLKERAKSQGMSVHGATFPQHPPGSCHGSGMPAVAVDQLTLPSAYRCTPGEAQGSAHGTAAVPVAAQTGARTAWMPSQHAKWQGGGGGGGYNVNANKISGSFGGGCRSGGAAAGFGILERAMSTATTAAAATSSCISIYAKSYHYGGGTGPGRNFSASRHQQHRYHHAHSQRVGSGQAEELATATAHGSSGNHAGQSRSGSSKHNNALPTENGTGFTSSTATATATATAWRATGRGKSNTSSSSGGPPTFPAQPRPGVEHPKESVAAQGVGKKRAKPEHYKDYR